MSCRTSITTLVVGGLLGALALVFFVGPHASSSPDGLEKVAADHQLDTGKRASTVAGSPLAHYSVSGVDDSGLSKGLAGALGVAITLGITLTATKLLTRRRSRPPAPSSAAP